MDFPMVFLGSPLASHDEVHFVDGSAFSLYGRPASDPSVPMEKAAPRRRRGMD